MSTTINTIREFKARSVSLFENNNYLQRGTTITWRGARKTTWRGGSSGFSGEFEVSHPSHKTVLIVASYDDEGLTIR